MLITINLGKLIGYLLSIIIIITIIIRANLKGRK